MKTIHDWLIELAPPQGLHSTKKLNAWIARMENGQEVYRKSKAKINTKCRQCDNMMWLSVRRASLNPLCPTCYAYYSRISSRAHQKVSFAVRKKIIPPASACKCKDCGDSASQYDHRDYSKPLEVDPVCISCNRRRGIAYPFYTNVRKCK